MRQVAWLQTKGWRFELNGNNCPIIVRRYAEILLGCGGYYEQPTKPKIFSIEGHLTGRKRQSNFDGPSRFDKKARSGVTSAGQRLGSGESSQATGPKPCGLWAQREGAREDDSTKLFSVVARRYVREVYPTTSIQTQLDKHKELASLLKVFAHKPIDAIAPMHIREYMDVRGQVAKVRANRKKALFSHLFSKARDWGYTATQNPCQGVKGFKETGRSRNITDAEFEQVKAQAHFTVVDAMDLALLTGQRPADATCLYKPKNVLLNAMVDHLDPTRRSANMTAIKSKNTSPEIKLRKLLHSLGYRYRLHAANLPGRPDIVFPARCKVIFVNGCFWHRHEGCKYTAMPKTRVEF